MNGDRFQMRTDDGFVDIRRDPACPYGGTRLTVALGETEVSIALSDTLTVLFAAYVTMAAAEAVGFDRSKL